MTDRSARYLTDPPTSNHTIAVTPERLEAEQCLKLAAAFTAEAVLAGRIGDAEHGAREVLAVIRELYGEEVGA